ncbi:S-adenosyl-L-methionine-dependent methyltransferase [Xylaria intraflava]|nr:S-adenosyl-L-methionine-dependent methyltransferase [Xylaria intraflava]
MLSTADATATADDIGRQRSGRAKVTLSGVSETLLISLFGRARDAVTESPILGDRYAKDVVARLDYDFERLPMPPTHAGAVALRARFYDRWAAAFLAAHAHATVLHLACGLDSRNQRVNWGPHVRWIDVDLPEVVALRRQVLPSTLPGKDYHLVGADATDDAWLEDVQTDQPVLVIMEGLLSYLEPADGRSLIKRLARRIKIGELHFECMSTAVLTASQKDKKTAVSRTGSVYKWAIDDLREIERIDPHLELLEVMRYVEAPGVEELPFMSRIGYYIMSWMPSMRDSVRFVRFGVSEDVEGRVKVVG